MKTNRPFSMVLMLALIIALTISAVQAQDQPKRQSRRPAGKIPPVSANAPSGETCGCVTAINEFGADSAFGKANAVLASLRPENTITVPGAYEINYAGGTAPVQGLEGKIGDVIFDGKWRFQVLSVQTLDSYTMKSGAEPAAAYNDDVAQWNSTNRVFLPKLGYKLVLMQCGIVNAVNQKRTLWVARADTNNALVDAEGGPHVPLAYDFEGGPIQSQPLSPGAKLDFAILFSVPESAQPKDLVFTLKTNDWQEKGNEARVSLSAGQKASAGATNIADSDSDQKATEVVSAPTNPGATASTEGTVMNAPSAGAAPAPSSASGPANIQTNSTRLGPKKPGVVRIGIVRPMAQLGAGGKAEADNASEAVRNTFAEYLNGPTLESVPLASRVTAQALVEARQNDCDYVLFSTLELKRADDASNPFGKALGNIASSSAASIGAAVASSVATKNTTTAPTSAAGAADSSASSAVGASAGSAFRSSTRSAAVTGIQTATALALGIQAKDEFRLEYKLAPVSGAPAILAKMEKLKATSDGEDLITRLVEKASEAIGLAVTKK